jgi:hypothetical protein
VEAHLAGHTTAVRDIEVDAGERAEVELALVPLDDSPGPWPYVTGSAGLGALAAAVLLHAGAVSASREANELSGPARIERRGAAEDRLAAAAVLYGVAGAAVVVTAYLLLQ